MFFSTQAEIFFPTRQWAVAAAFPYIRQVDIVALF